MYMYYIHIRKNKIHFSFFFVQDKKVNKLMCSCLSDLYYAVVQLSDNAFGSCKYLVLFFLFKYRYKRDPYVDSKCIRILLNILVFTRISDNTLNRRYIIHFRK